MSTTYTRETLQEMDENDLGYVYETVTNQTVPSRPKRKQLIEEILATQTISSPTRGRKTSKSPSPKSASRSASRSPGIPRSKSPKSPRPEKTKTKSDISLSPPVTTVRSTMIKAPKKAVSPMKQNIVVSPDVTARLIIQKEIEKDKEKGTPTTPSETPVKRGRGRPPKSKKSEESPRTSSDEYGPPKSPTSDKKSLVENMKSQMKDIKVLNPKGSFQTATIREKQPGIITPIVVSDVNVSTVALPVNEEAKISIADFLSRIGGGPIEKQLSPRPSPVKTTIVEEEIKVSPPPSIPGRKTYKPKPGEFIKESKLEEGTVLLRPSDEEGEAVKIVSKKIAKIVPPSEEVVSDEEGEKEIDKEIAKAEQVVSKTIKLIPKIPEEVREEKKEEKKPRRRATVVKRTSETLEIPSEQQVEQAQVELPASPKIKSRVSSRAASPIRARSPSRSPSGAVSPLPSPRAASPEPSPKPTKKIVSIPDISDIPSEKKSTKKKVSPKTLQKIEEEIDFEKVPLTKTKKSIVAKIPTPVTSSAESIDSEELLDIPLKQLSKKQISKITKKIETTAPVTAPITAKKTTKKPTSPIASPIASPSASPSPSPVLVRRTTKTTLVKETPKGPKEVIKDIETEEEEIEEPVSASQAEEIFTRITSGASSKASSKAPSRVPSRVPSERKTVDAYAVFEKLNVKRDKVNVSRAKNYYTGKQLEEILIELGLPHTGKKEVLVNRVLDKMTEAKYDM